MNAIFLRVILAKAGIHLNKLRVSALHYIARRRGLKWIPAFARMTVLLILASFTLPALAEPRNYNAPEGQVSSLLILESSGFARIYGMFTKGVARISYDDQNKVMDNLKVAFLVTSFQTSSPTLRSDMFGSTRLDATKENEVAFVQNEPARFNGSTVAVKGDLIINGMRHAVSMDTTLNKFGRINQNTDIESDGAMTMGLSLHTTFKRSDFGLSLTKEASPFDDEAILMIDIIGMQ